MRTREMKSAIKRGIKLLDERVLDWRDRIDLDELDLSNSQSCILGQSFGAYGKGKYLLGLTAIESAKLGFNILDVSWWDENDFETQYNRLTQLWKEALS